MAHSLKISLNLEENITPSGGSLVFIKLVETQEKVTVMLEQSCFVINESNLHCVRRPVSQDRSHEVTLNSLN